MRCTRRPGLQEWLRPLNFFALRFRPIRLTRRHIISWRVRGRRSRPGFRRNSTCSRTSIGPEGIRRARRDYSLPPLGPVDFSTGRYSAKRRTHMSSPISAAPAGAASKPRSNSNPVWVALAGATLLALLFAGIHVAQRIRSSHGIRLEFSVASRTPFRTEIPRQAQLTLIYPNGSTQTLLSRCYAAAFLDLQSTFRFEILDESVQRVAFSPALGDDVFAITRISLTPAGKREPELISENSSRFPQRWSARGESDARKTAAAEGPASFGPLFDEAPSRWPTRPIIFERSRFHWVVCVVFLVIRSPSGKLRKAPYAELADPILPLCRCDLLILAMALLTKFNAHPTNIPLEMARTRRSLVRQR